MGKVIIILLMLCSIFVYSQKLETAIFFDKKDSVMVENTRLYIFYRENIRNNIKKKKTMVDGGIYCDIGCKKELDVFLISKEVSKPKKVKYIQARKWRDRNDNNKVVLLNVDYFKVDGKYYKYEAEIIE